VHEVLRFIAEARADEREPAAADAPPRDARES